MNSFYNRSNFHKNTFCDWQEILLSEVGNINFQHKSKSGSSYAFVEKGVFRISNHWGRVALCRWRLNSLVNYKNQHSKIGFATWEDFYPNDEKEKLFFIILDYDTCQVTFHHKFSALFEDKFILRTATEAAKTIQLIKEILEESNWAKYLKYNDIVQIRKEIVNELLYTSKSYMEIKKKYL